MYSSVVPWVELLVQRRLCPIFVKSGVLKKGTQWSGVGLPDIHEYSVVDDSFQIQVGVWNQQNLQPRIPTTDVAKLLQYSGSRVEHRDGFSS